MVNSLPRLRPCLILVLISFLIFIYELNMSSFKEEIEFNDVIFEGSIPLRSDILKSI
jgi:hypothetical protein